MGKHEKPAVAFIISHSWWGSYGQENAADPDLGIFLSREDAQEVADRRNEEERKWFDARANAGFSGGDKSEYYVDEYDLYE